MLFRRQFIVIVMVAAPLPRFPVLPIDFKFGMSTCTVTVPSIRIEVIYLLYCTGSLFVVVFAGQPRFSPNQWLRGFGFGPGLAWDVCIY